jgi:hypothetical protein
MDASVRTWGPQAPYVVRGLGVFVMPLCAVVATLPRRAPAPVRARNPVAQVTGVMCCHDQLTQCQDTFNNPIPRDDFCLMESIPEGVNRLSNPDFNSPLGSTWTLSNSNLSATVAASRVNVSVTAPSGTPNVPLALFQSLNMFHTKGNCQLQLSAWGMMNDAAGATPAYLWVAQGAPGSTWYWPLLMSHGQPDGVPWGPRLPGQSWVASRGGSLVKVCVLRREQRVAASECPLPRPVGAPSALAVLPAFLAVVSAAPVRCPVASTPLPPPPAPVWCASPAPLPAPLAPAAFHSVPRRQLPFRSLDPLCSSPPPLTRPPSTTSSALWWG